jgi:hypothetical protein
MYISFSTVRNGVRARLSDMEKKKEDTDKENFAWIRL